MRNLNACILLLVVTYVLVPVNANQKGSPNTKVDCGGALDLVLAVPGSYQLPGQEFFPFERFLVMLADYFVLDAENTNIGLILYGKNPVPISRPQPPKTQDQINARITLLSQRVLYQGDLLGETDVNSALLLMHQMFRSPSGYPLVQPRPNVTKIGVIFVNGKAAEADVDKVIATAAKMKKDGITMYAVGRGPTGREFPQIATDYCKLFSVGSFIEGLPSLLPYLGSSLCTALTSNVTVTTKNCFPEIWQPSPNPHVECPAYNDIFQDPYNCAYYYKCDNREPSREACPLNMLFDNNIKACNHKEAVTCYSMLTCPQPNGLFPHPDDCHSYLNCFENIPYVQQCPPLLRFDSNSRFCRDERLVPCRVY